LVAWLPDHHHPWVPLEALWRASGALEGLWRVTGGPLEGSGALEGLWRASGGPLEDIGVSGGTLEEAWA